MTGGAQDSGALHRLVGELADALQDASNNGFGEEFFRIHVKELIERARATPAPAGWQPIESAPRDGTPILAYGPLPGCNADNHGWQGVRETKWKCYPLGSPGYAAWQRGEGPLGIGWDWYESVHNWSHVWKPTHWMPLPTAPAEGGV